MKITNKSIANPTWSSLYPRRIIPVIIYSCLRCQAFLPHCIVKLVKFDELVLLGFSSSGDLHLSPPLKHDFVHHHWGVSCFIAIESPKNIAISGVHFGIFKSQNGYVDIYKPQASSGWFFGSASGQEIAWTQDPQQVSPETILYIYRYSTCYDKYILIYICYIIDLKLGRNLSIFSVDCEFRQDLLPAEPAVCVPVQSTITAWMVIHTCENKCWNIYIHCMYIYMWVCLTYIRMYIL